MWAFLSHIVRWPPGAKRFIRLSIGSTSTTAEAVDRLWGIVDRAAPAQAVMVNDNIYLVDAGNGVGRQLVRAGLNIECVN